LVLVAGLLFLQQGQPRLVFGADAATKDSSAAASTKMRAGEDWASFLGPRGTGISGETGFAKSWPKQGPPMVWERKIGTGYSAPSVLGHRLVVSHRVGDNEIVECMHATTGKTIWTYKHPTQYQDPYGYNNGPRATPILTKNRCYTFGAAGSLLCLDLEKGTKIWVRETQKDFKLPSWFFGIGCTPILEGNLLIVLVGGQPNSGVVAFNAKTGATVWQRVGKETWDGVKTDRGDTNYKWTGSEQVVSYSSPIAVTIHGKRHILCLVRQGLVSLDPRDGSERFNFWFRPRVHESVNAARPLVIGDKIFLSASYNLGSALLQVNPDSKSFKVVWQNRRNMQNHWSTTIHVDGFLYGFSGRHSRESRLRCVSLETGRVGWGTDGFEGEIINLVQDPKTGGIVDRQTGKAVPFPFYGRGSKIKVEDQFIVLGEGGTLALVKINPKKFEEISRTAYPQIHNPAWTAPVLSRKRLFLRAEKSLICLDLAKEPGAAK